MNAKAIGNLVGFRRGRCLRIRINIDIGQTLCQGIKVNIGESSPQWVSFQYERMPIFC